MSLRSARWSVIVLTVGVAACSSTLPRPAPRSAVSSEQPSPVVSPQAVRTAPFARDEAQATAHGTGSFIVPAGWSLSKEADVTRVFAPEGDEVFAIVDVAEPNAESAIAAAWQALRRTPSWQIDQRAEWPAREGWQGGLEISYDVPPNLGRTLRAFALHGDARTVVVVLDTDLASFERRSSSLSLLANSLRPTGYQRESFAGRTAHTLDATRLAKLDALVELAQKELAIPGVALAIVQGGQTVQLRGYGVREQGKPELIDGDTLFLAASTTKALTTLLLAQLVDEGKLRWDMPISEALPGVRIGSEATTRAMQIKHLVCACTGLPRQDWDWIIEFDKSTPSELLRSLARVEPTTEFGETFQYSNQMAAAAGYIAASVLSQGKELGRAYDDAMRERIFTPLDMRTSTFDFARASRANHATGHGWDVDGKLAVVAPKLNHSVRAMRPAGGLWSSARDMIRYVQLELAGGVVPGSTRRLVSEANLLERRAKQVALGEHSVYGMGLGVDTTFGTPVVGHNGSMFGFKANMFWLPEHNVGAVMLTNSDYGYLLLGALERAILEQLFDGKPEAVDDLLTGTRNLRSSLTSDRNKLSVPPDPELAAGLAARYVESTSTLGALTLRQDKGQSTLDVGEWQSPVASRRNEDGTLSLVTIGPGIVGIPFVAGQTKDGKRSLTLRDAQHEYAFVEP
jgi:CubicO group peptidase (beta-lactamase class C family)